MNNDFINQIPWKNESSPIWLATHFTVSRNLASYSFPQMLKEKDAAKVAEKLKKKLLGSKQLNNPQYCNIDELTSAQKEYLCDYFYLPTGITQSVAHQGVIVDDTTQFLALINQNNHLSLRYIESGCDWNETWNRLMQCESELEKALHFAFSPKFGFLSADPIRSGTGLTTQTFLHLPALIFAEALPKFLREERSPEVIIKGLNGDGEEFIGDLVIVENSYSLGVSEDQILDKVHSISTKLMLSELELRKQIRESAPGELLDKIGRFFGILKHAQRIDTKEAMAALSLLKLGLHLGYIKGIDDKQLNACYFTCRRGSIMQNEQITSLDAVPFRRASLLKETLDHVELTL